MATWKIRCTRKNKNKKLLDNEQHESNKPPKYSLNKISYLFFFWLTSIFGPVFLYASLASSHSQLYTLKKIISGFSLWFSAFCLASGNMTTKLAVSRNMVWSGAIILSARISIWMHNINISRRGTETAWQWIANRWNWSHRSCSQINQSMVAYNFLF